VDVSDPMQIAIFCKEFNIILLLDSKFSQIGEPIQMDQIGFSSVKCVCKSRQNGIWMFDSFSQKLVLYSLGSKGLIREIELQKYSKSLANVEGIIESADRIYFYGQGCALMDISQFGGHLEISDIYPSTRCQIKNEQILYTDLKNFFSYHLKTSEKKTVQIVENECFDDIKVGYEKVFVLSGDSITILTKMEGF
jgi:hypothetical protein